MLTRPAVRPEQSVGRLNLERSAHVPDCAGHRLMFARPVATALLRHAIFESGPE